MSEKKFKCERCRSIETKQIVKDRIEGTVCEAEIRCKNCNSYIDYFAYGSYESEGDVS